MELLILFFIAAIGAAWWLNYVWKKNAADDAKKLLEKQETLAPYKVEPIESVQPISTAAKEVEIKPVATETPTSVTVPAVETAVVEKVKKPRKPAVKKPVPATKARVKKTVAKKKAASK